MTKLSSSCARLVRSRAYLRQLKVRSKPLSRKRRLDLPATGSISRAGRWPRQTPSMFFLALGLCASLTSKVPDARAQVEMSPADRSKL